MRARKTAQNEDGEKMRGECTKRSFSFSCYCVDKYYTKSFYSSHVYSLLFSSSKQQNKARGLIIFLKQNVLVKPVRHSRFLRKLMYQYWTAVGPNTKYKNILTS